MWFVMAINVEEAGSLRVFIDFDYNKVAIHR